MTFIMLFTGIRPAFLFYRIVILFSFFTVVGCQQELSTPSEISIGAVSPRPFTFVLPAYDIILLMGQSNTLAGKGFDSTLDTVDFRVMQLGRKGFDNYKIIVANEPLQNFTPMDSCIGFAFTFAKLYAASKLEKSRKVLIIPCGANGSGFLHNGGWNRQDSLYKDAVLRTNFVLRKYPGSSLKCILWHQGEADYTLGAVNYQWAFERMKKFLSTDIKTEQVDSIPFILGGLVPFWVNTFPNKNVLAIDSVLRNEQNRIPFTGFADPTKPFVINKLDNKENPIHFDANGQREMGKRYFQEYERLSK